MGKKALEFVRYRSDRRGDIGRIERQKDFLRSIIKKMDQINIMTKSRMILKMFLKYTYTNLKINDLNYLRRYQQDLDLENLDIVNVPGESKYIDKISYYVVDIANSDMYIKKFLEGVSDEPQEDIIRVEVLNGSGIIGIAESVSSYLRKNNIDVILIGNAGRFDYEKTIVYDRTGDIKNAFVVGNLLSSKEIYKEKLDDSIVHVTVIVGKDMEQFLKNK